MQSYCIGATRDVALSPMVSLTGRVVKAPLDLNPEIDWPALSPRFAASGRIQISDFLSAPSADALHRALVARHDWRHVISAGAKVFEVARTDLDAMPAAQIAALEQALHAEATRQFRFRYDLIRTPEPLPPLAEADAGAEHDIPTGEDPLIGFARLINAPATLARLRRLAPGLGLDFADAQATRYTPGDFLTRHDDAVAGKGRLMAYVLGLTPDWAAEWGGLLLFHGPDGSIVETFAPRFNALSLFTVPQPHSVSFVAPYAGAARISVTGWLRTRE